MDASVLGRENASQNGAEASRRRRKVGAMVLGRENASKNGAEAWLAMSTSTQSMSTIMQPTWWSYTQVLWRRPFRTAAMAHNKLFTSEAAAGKSFYCASPSAAAAKHAQMLWRRPAATMIQKRANGSLELLDGYWKLFNSITPSLLVGCGT